MLVIPAVGRRRQENPWELMGSQPSLLNEVLTSERPCFKINMTAFWEVKPEVVPCLLHTHTYTRTHTCTLTCIHEHTHTHSTHGHVRTLRSSCHQARTRGLNQQQMLLVPWSWPYQQCERRNVYCWCHHSYSTLWWQNTLTLNMGCWLLHNRDRQVFILPSGIL